MSSCNSVSGCPAVEELDCGDFLVVGSMTYSSDTTAATLAENMGLGIEPGERAVIVPRQTMLSAIYAHARKMSDE